MSKRHTAVFSCFFIPMLLLSTSFLHARETDSLFQQLPEILAAPNNLYISNTGVSITKNTSLIILGNLVLNNSDIAGKKP